MVHYIHNMLMAGETYNATQFKRNTTQGNPLSISQPIKHDLPL